MKGKIFLFVASNWAKMLISLLPVDYLQALLSFFFYPKWQKPILPNFLTYNAFLTYNTLQLLVSAFFEKRCALYMWKYSISFLCLRLTLLRELQTSMLKHMLILKWISSVSLNGCLLMKVLKFSKKAEIWFPRCFDLKTKTKKPLLTVCTGQ